jgi:heme/copper-type cytochrome/quinol oxidase subunit 3
LALLGPVAALRAVSLVRRRDFRVGRRHYGKNVDKSFRWSMSWFIFSEVMFFGAFFGALFYAREIALPSSAA